MASSFALIVSALLPAFTSAPIAHSGAFDKVRADEHLQTLATEHFAGRLTLTLGNEMAAEYLAQQLVRMGLEPVGANGYFHRFPVTVNSRLGADNLLVARMPNVGDVKLKPGADFVPVANSASNQAISGPLIWVGQGGAADYETVDVKGKIVLVLRGPTKVGESVATNATKARIASERGAIGILFAGPQPEGKLDLPTTSTSQGIPRGSTLTAAAVSKEWLKQFMGQSHADLVRAPGPSKGLPITVTLRTDLKPNRGWARNVIGMLPGTDPKLKNEYIVIGAHYDHLGYGEVGSRTGIEQIHCGADDNASGTTAVLLLADHFSKSKVNRRTMLFQFYSGEEVGLVGSENWVKDNLEIVKKTTLMINLDMVGRLRKEELSVFGAESSKELPGILSEVGVPGLKVVPIATIPGNSDHASFTKRGVPAIAPFTGFHDEYHTERDRLETLNVEGICLVAQASATVAERVDALPFKMVFRQPKSGSERAPSAENSRGRRVRTGFVPNMADAGPGLLIDSVGLNSPAMKAGVLPGDRLIRFGSMKVNGLEDLQAALQEAKAGIPVKIAIMRGGQEIELEIVPAAIE